MGKNNNSKNSNNSTPAAAATTTKQQQTSAATTSSKSSPTTTSSNNNAAASSSSSSSPKFQIPKASPISIYSDDSLSEREKFLLSKMEKMKLYKPKELPKPRLNRNRGWIHVLLEKYNIETALYMIEPWERWILNTLLILFFLLIGYWAVWAYNASIGNYNEYFVPAVDKIREIISS